ncbi:MAG: hypothetical protein FP816_12290 [Desulfobacteraceae bacterium]|nr:hypothetical protein [Desulfobacteraceae bacterium]
MMNTQFLKMIRKWGNRLSEKIIAYREQRHDEKLLLNEIDRIISETKTKIPLVPGYRKRLIEPLRQALRKIDTMTSLIPGPITLEPEQWETSPVLNAVFIGPDDFIQWMNNCTPLQNAMTQNPSPDFYGLLSVRVKEKTAPGVAMIGNVVQKDVLQRSVTFEDPRIMVIRSELEEAKNALGHRTLVILFTRELEEIAEIKALTEELEKQQSILELELSFEKRHGTSDGNKDETVQEARKLIQDMDDKIDKIGRHPNSPENHLNHVTEVLMNMERHLSVKPFTIRINSLGVLVNTFSQEAYDEISFADCTFAGGPRRCVIWVKVSSPTKKTTHIT